MIEKQQEIEVVDHILTTTRAVRFNYDFERAVDRAIVEECLRIGFQAPTGGNQQNWAWVVVGDPETKRHMADIYRAGMAWNNRALPERPKDGRLDAKGFEQAIAELRANPPDGQKRISIDHDEKHGGKGGSGFRMYHQPEGWVGPSRGSDFLAVNMERLPYLLVPAFRVQDREAFNDSVFLQGCGWGSVLQAVWNFMLALRVRGLGSTWGTVHLHFEEEMGDLLGIPRNYVQAGMFPIGWASKANFKPADRSFSEATAIHWDRW